MNRKQQPRRGAIGRRLRPIDIGAFTHALVASMVRESGWPTGAGMALWILAKAGALLASIGATSRRRAALQKAASLASVYAQAFRPRPDWGFIGAELELEGERIDLVFQAPEGVLFDEIKTSADALGIGESATAAQVGRYVAAGLRTYGKRFQGVRVITLALPRRSSFVSPDGTWTPLAATAWQGGIR